MGDNDIHTGFVLRRPDIRPQAECPTLRRVLPRHYALYFAIRSLATHISCRLSPVPSRGIFLRRKVRNARPGLLSAHWHTRQTMEQQGYRQGWTVSSVTSLVTRRHKDSNYGIRSTRSERRGKCGTTGHGKEGDKIGWTRCATKLKQLSK